MLRLLFVLLLLAHVAWLGYVYGLPYLETPAKPLPELNPAQLVLRPAAEVQVASAPVSPEVIPVCYEWRGLSPARVAGARTALQALGVAGSIDEHAVVAPDAKFWVYMPPQTSRAAAEKKITELSDLGVAEYHLETSGKWQWAISLGVFSTEERAQKFLQDLRGKGVRSARMGPREGGISSVRLLFTLPDESLVEPLLQLREDHEGSHLQALACPVSQ